MRGRHPKPALLHLLEGTGRGEPRNELKPPPGAPEPPPRLTPAQLERWREIVASLPAGLLTKADAQVIERFAVSWATFQEADNRINETGLTMTGRHGEEVRSPLMVIRKQAAEEMRTAGLELGLSPIARTRLVGLSDSTDSDDPMTRLMSSLSRVNRN